MICQSLYCETEIEDAHVEYCGDCQLRVLDAVKVYPAIREVPRDLRFLRRFGAGCKRQDLAEKLGKTVREVDELVDVRSKAVVFESEIVVTRPGFDDLVSSSRIDPTEIARMITGVREGWVISRRLPEWWILKRYSDVVRHPEDLTFLRAYLKDGCTSLELANQIGMPRVTLLGLINNERKWVRAVQELRVCGKRRCLTWVISAKEIARVIVTYRYHVGVFELSKRHGKRIDYYTLLADVREGRFGRRLRTLTGALAIHQDRAEQVLERYQEIRQQKLPANRGVESSLDLTSRDFAVLLGCSVKTIQARTAKDNIPHQARRHRFVYRRKDVVSYLHRVIAKNVKAGSAINPATARRALAAGPQGTNRKLLVKPP